MNCWIPSHLLSGNAGNQTRPIAKGEFRKRNDHHMKRRELLKHLSENGCEELREGKKHTSWRNPALNKYSTIPRHTDISNFLWKTDLRRSGRDDYRLK